MHTKEGKLIHNTLNMYDKLVFINGVPINHINIPLAMRMQVLKEVLGALPRPLYLGFANE